MGVLIRFSFLKVSTFISLGFRASENPSSFNQDNRKKTPRIPSNPKA